MQFLDKYGWPIEQIKSRWFQNILRRVIHTRRIKRGTYRQLIAPDPCCGQQIARTVELTPGTYHVQVSNDPKGPICCKLIGDQEIDNA